MYEKARNIVKNNLQKQQFVIKVTAKTAHYIVMAYHRFQAEKMKKRHG